MKEFKNLEVKTISGKPFQIPDEESGKPGPCTDAVKLLTIIVYSLPRQQLTMKDAIEAQRIIRQFDAVKDGTLRLEDAEHDWIKAKVDAAAPQIFGVNAVVLADFLEAFERLHTKEAN